MAERESQRHISAVCGQLAQAMGYELVEAGIEKEGPGRYLRIYLDKPGGLTLDDCEAYHRAIQPQMEHVDYDFLEVCSPGLDRPLKTQQDFERHLGTRVSLKLYKPIDKRKEFEGELLGLQDGEVTLRTPQGVVHFAHQSVALVRPMIDLSALDDPLEPGV
ncbi:MAG: ribosome maturation factor RimP [Oscillospiraceae bacterium]|nr:ribosome maturation factor RimP [Oscillospiraceae bacterium]